jgi:DNA-nicking Smr family endonuclease
VRKGKKKRPKAGKEQGPSPFNPLPPMEINTSEPRPLTPSPASRIAEIDEDRAFFLEAMKGVKRLNFSTGRVSPRPKTDMRPPRPAPDDELEVMAHLSDLLSGQAEMDITFSDEYIEGCIKGFSRELMARLRRGQFPLQAHLDLHGLTKQEAEARVKEFLLESYRLGRRCVLIVHGRGLNSENNIPVLKERIPVWLARGPVKRVVLAFSTARPYDGGTGAVYVLIRRQRSERGGNALRLI